MTTLAKYHARVFATFMAMALGVWLVFLGTLGSSETAQAKGYWGAPCTGAIAYGNNSGVCMILAIPDQLCRWPQSGGQTYKTQFKYSCNFYRINNDSGCYAYPQSTFYCGSGANYGCLVTDVKTSDGWCIDGPATIAIKESCGSGGAAKGGNPVEIGTGRKIEHVVDWSSGGDFPLTFERNYSSTYLVFEAPYYTRLGYSWRSNFDSAAKLYFPSGAALPTQAADGDRIHIVLPDANEYSFIKNAGAWKHVLPSIGPALVSWNTYRTDLDYSLAVTDQNIDLRTETGDIYRYNLKGQLTQILFPNGYIQNLYYSGTFNTKVIDSLGRMLSFEYWGGTQKVGLLKTVTTSDGKKLDFDYVVPTASLSDPTPPITSIDAQALALGSVTYPDATPAVTTDNPKRVYEYWQNGEFPYALTAIYDERGVKYGSWSYDSKGRAVSSKHGVNDDLTTFAFDDVNNKVTVTNPLGRQTTYSFQTAFGITKRLLAVDGIATTNCAASNTTYAFDANGYRNQATDAEGRVTKMGEGCARTANLHD